MKRFFTLVIFTIIVCFSVQGQNMLLQHDNTPIDYTKVNPGVIREAERLVKKSSDKKIKAIIDAADHQTIENTLMALDEIKYYGFHLGAKLGLISATLAHDSTRNTAHETLNKLRVYFYRNVYLNQPLYNAIKKFKESKWDMLTSPQKKFLEDEIFDFEQNGMKLDEKARNKLEVINQKLVELGTQFEKNIAENKDSIIFTAADLKGIPGDVMDSWKRGDNTYVVNVNGPNRIIIAEDASNSKTRKEMYLRYNNRAYPKNMEVLDSLFYYRHKLANLLGYRSFAAYTVADKMAGTTEKVWAFENGLKEKLEPLLTNDIKTLTVLKKQLYPSETDTLFAWDIRYLNKKLLSTSYNLDKDKVKEYFEINNTIKGMFTVFEDLLDIKIKETTGIPVWDNKVKTYEMWVDGKKAGNFYLDLYPRQNKFTHFAQFPMNFYRRTDSSEILPRAALVCNFPEATAEKPSLLSHGEVITMFHEFGHLVHDLLSHPKIFSQSSSFVKGDFGEAPSQLLENWCWEYDALKLFAKNYKTGKPLPYSLFLKMKQSRFVNAGYSNMRQVYLGIMDFTYEDKYETVQEKGIMNVYKDAYSLLQLPFPEGSHLIYSFGHLNNYGANYYGYLWSKVYAQDMFSVFQKNGVMDRETGIRYRKEILEKGATKPEIDIVEKFLGRKPNSDAFIQSLGLKN